MCDTSALHAARIRKARISRLAARNARALLVPSHPFQRKGAGKTGRRLAPIETRAETFCARNARGHTGEAGNNPAFPAQWFDGLRRALPGDEFLLAPSPCELTDAVDPVEPTTAFASLGCSNDSRDHALWPYAWITSFVRAPHHRSRRAIRPATVSAPDAISVHRNPAHDHGDGRPPLFIGPGWRRE